MFNYYITYTFSSASGLPLYGSSGQCVETCPNGQFGSGSVDTLTGICEQSEYRYRRSIVH